jgi:altronate dehydratase
MQLKVQVLPKKKGGHSPICWCVGLYRSLPPNRSQLGLYACSNDMEATTGKAASGATLILLELVWVHQLAASLSHY